MRSAELPPDPGAEPPDDVSCTRCGSFSIEHVTGKPTDRHKRHFPRDKVQWFNRCRDCGRRDDYTPNKAMIAVECEKIRSQALPPEFHDHPSTLDDLLDAA